MRFQQFILVFSTIFISWAVQAAPFQRQPILTFSASKKMLVETQRNGVFFFEVCDVEPSIVSVGLETLQEFLNQTHACQSVNSTFFEPTAENRAYFATEIPRRVTDLLDKNIKLYGESEIWGTAIIAGLTVGLLVANVWFAKRKGQGLDITDKIYLSGLNLWSAYNVYYDVRRYLANSPQIVSGGSPIDISQLIPEWQLKPSKAFESVVAAVDEVTASRFRAEGPK